MKSFDGVDSANPKSDISVKEVIEGIVVLCLQSGVEIRWEESDEKAQEIIAKIIELKRVREKLTTELNKLTDKHQALFGNKIPEADSPLYKKYNRFNYSISNGEKTLVELNSSILHLEVFISGCCRPSP
jgi:hypothetical protein